MSLLAINWGQVGLQAAQLILSLSILVIIHELGHYLTAKWFKCRVEKFYLFFDPWFSLFKKKVGETEYGVGWLPLGGYVKISGMIDESMDKEQMNKPPQAWEFRSKPAWQRLIIMIAGVTMNILLAFVIYAMILFVWGDTKTPNASLKNGVWVTDSLMLDIGFRSGDKIVSVNEQEVTYFDDIPKKILFNSGSAVKIIRDGREETIKVPIKLIGDLVERRKAKVPLFLERVPTIVGEFGSGDSTNGQKAGLKYQDKVIAVDNTPVEFMDQIVAYTNTKRNQPVTVQVLRGSDTVALAATVPESGKLGIPLLTEAQYDSLGVFALEKKSYSFFGSFPAGVTLAITTLSDYIDQFKLILKPSTGAYKGVGGFKAMGSIFSPISWNWESFWKITALFSIVLAFMNLLPIPALDGGHVLFTLIEMITGRKPSDKFLEYAQIVGMIILFSLLLYANGNDWFGWGRGK
ncbi:MAG: RIP metalloprotease RseP [Chitinophagaceae bacterium]|nr:RIP metalloprotease RseP [Chitinophagaceae bacterium]